MPDYNALAQHAKSVLGDILTADPWEYDDHLILHIRREGLLKTSEMLKKDPVFSCEFLQDITAVDYPKKRPRFEVVYHWYSYSKKHRVRVKALVPEEDPTIDSTMALTRAGDWFERETYDMYGIQFNGHPDLRRILLYEEFEGFPLRKTHPVNRTTPRIQMRTPHKPQKTRWESIHGSADGPMVPRPEEEAPGPKATGA